MQIRYADITLAESLDGYDDEYDDELSSGEFTDEGPQHPERRVVGQVSCVQVSLDQCFDLNSTCRAEMSFINAVMIQSCLLIWYLIV